MSASGAPLAAVPALGYASARDGQAGQRGFSMLTMFPMLTLSLFGYAVITLIGGQGWIETELVTVGMISGNDWRIRAGDAFLMISLVFLFIEILRATKTGTDSLLNHALSAVLFVLALLLFITIDGFGNSVFFIFVMMTALDFMAGFIVTTVTARRDFGVTGGLSG